MFTAAFVVATAVALGAQDTTRATVTAAGEKEPVLVPLKVQLVLSRYQGEKKISSVPYVLWLIANDRGRGTNLRMGNKIPVVSTTFRQSGAPVASYNYQDVGTNIDCSATTTADGNYRVNLTVTDSSVYFPDPNNAAAAAPAKTGAPAFRNFTSNFYILLRDGQSGQYLSATDPITGQVLKLDVTLNVLK